MSLNRPHFFVSCTSRTLQEYEFAHVSQGQDGLPVATKVSADEDRALPVIALVQSNATDVGASRGCCIARTNMTMAVAVLLTSVLQPMA